MPRPSLREWRTYSPRSYIMGRCEFCGASPRHGPRGGMLSLASANPGWQYRGRPAERSDLILTSGVVIRCHDCAAAGRGDGEGGQHG